MGSTEAWQLELFKICVLITLGLAKTKLILLSNYAQGHFTVDIRLSGHLIESLGRWRMDRSESFPTIWINLLCIMRRIGEEDSTSLVMLQVTQCHHKITWQLSQKQKVSLISWHAFFVVCLCVNCKKKLLKKKNIMFFMTKNNI